MFGVDSSEFMLIVLVAVVVIGPKDLPRVMRVVGKWVGKARGMANQFRSGVDQMVRDSEVAELEQKWREQNESIMRAHPNAPPVSDWGTPTAPPAPPAQDGDVAPLGASARPAPVAPASSAPEPAPLDGAEPAPAIAQPAAAAPDLRQPPAAAPMPLKPAAVTPPRAADAS